MNINNVDILKYLAWKLYFYLSDYHILNNCNYLKNVIIHIKIFIQASCA